MSQGDDKNENFLELFQSECVKNDLLDEKNFLQLYSEVGADVLAEIVMSYSNTLDESFSGLRLLINSPNSEKSYRLCHKLKGSSQLVGFLSLAKICEQVCADHKNHNRTVELNFLKQILDQIAAIKEAIIVAQNP